MFLPDPPLDDHVRSACAEDVAADGFVHEATRIWSWLPDAAEAFAAARAVLAQELRLTPREIAVVIAAATSAMGDGYCSLVWGTRLAGLSSERTAAGVLAGEAADLPARELALAAWARRVADAPGATTPSDVQRLRAAGLHDRDIAAVTMLVAFRVAFATVNDALGVRPEPETVASAPQALLTAVRESSPGRTPG